MSTTLPTELVVAIQLLAGTYVSFWLWVLAAIALDIVRRRCTTR